MRHVALSLFSALATAGLVSCSGGTGASGNIAIASIEAREIEYWTDWEEAVEEARQENKPILLNFGGPW